jgi:hypothetical protein
MVWIRLAMGVLVMALIIALIFRLTRTPGPRLPRIRRRQTRAARHEFESRTDQIYRKLKGIKGPDEHRDEILDFIRTRPGVEAYVEPKTIMSHLSVVLVAEDGEWKRFELTDDSLLRAIERELHMPIYDAGRTGYPERMRRFKRKGLPPGEEPPADPSARDEGERPD